jgi:hypothetical protein
VLEAVDITAGQQISELTASRDLRALVGATLLDPVGERRGRYYLQGLLGVRARIRRGRKPKDLSDPFDRAGRQLELALD